MEKRITHDMLIELGNNIMVIYKLVYPNGLSIEELEEKANKHAFYRGIYDHVKRMVEE